MGGPPGRLAILLGVAALALGVRDVEGAETPWTAECRPACVPPLPDCCFGHCTRLSDDPKNCRTCGRDCFAEGKECEDGECVVRCIRPLVRRGDECVLVCDPPCAADEICTEYGLWEAKCCANPPVAGRLSQCGDTCCPPTFHCCDDYYCCPFDRQQCCNGDCCAAGDICLAEPNLLGSHCCAPADFCDDTCCVGGQQCAPDGRCRAMCDPACDRDEVCCGGSAGGISRSTIPTAAAGAPGERRPLTQTSSATPGRCVKARDLCAGECCLESERCGASSQDPGRKVCCPAPALCNGVCCGDGEVCVGGKCAPAQRDCEPPCGPNESCCTDFKCCECCTADNACGRKQVQPYRGTNGEEIWICVPLEAPRPRPSWLDPNACRTPTKSNCKSTGRDVGRNFNVNMVMCERSYRACGTVWTRTMGPVESRPGVCPPCTLPFPELCCDRWHEAERTKEPCDPSSDADCDGAPNDLDDDPFVPRAE